MSMISSSTARVRILSEFTSLSPTVSLKGNKHYVGLRIECTIALKGYSGLKITNMRIGNFFIISVESSVNA